jgi:DNA-binding NtrC family response regulator
VAVEKWILVVEDDPEAREAMVDLFNSSGFPARGTASVDDAFDLIVERKPSLVLSDINLGKHHGGELMEMAINILGPGVAPFVFVTGMPEDEVPALTTAAPVLRKPVAIDDLLDIAARYCRAGGRTKQTLVS